MKIADIKLGLSAITVEAKVVEIGEPRDVNTKYGVKSVADAILEDETGQIKLSLWEGQIESVAIGDTVVVHGAYVTQFRNTLQLSIPKSGKLEKLD
ncbi:MAG: DNA-binding protein [Candidatus Aenigmarchaeota archaeon]|nr:DNA-binding protein [Candidatus Aenigmarchaeota archaeon]